MNKKELISAVSKDSGLSRDEVKKLLFAFSQSVAESLSKNEKVTISGFGSFVPSKRKARIGINPRTQEKINIPASKTASFRPSKYLKAKII